MDLVDQLPPIIAASTSWPQAGDLATLLTRLALDLGAVLVLAYGLYLRRHRRGDRALVLTTLNVGLWAVLAIISTRHIGVGLGFGLFAVLSLIRLRSEPFDNTELSYVFAALVLALVNGIPKTPELLAGALSVLVLGALALADQPSLRQTIRRRRITLDTIETDAAKLRERIAAEHGIDIVDIAITAVDHVRETTRVVARYRAGAADPLPGGAGIDDD